MASSLNEHILKGRTSHRDAVDFPGKSFHYGSRQAMPFRIRGSFAGTPLSRKRMIACAVMYVSSGPVSRFVAEHPTTKMLALAFLVLIGVALVADGFSFHIPRGYIYFAIAFSAAVEFFNVLARRNRGKARG